jgi:hypothetical protein
MIVVAVAAFVVIHYHILFSALSLIAQVLIKVRWGMVMGSDFLARVIMSLGNASTSDQPSWSKIDRTTSLSETFIWQPYVYI